MARTYHQGIFKPKNPEKYVGNVNNIVFRSSWENKFMHWADKNPSVVQWGSEEVIIPYFSPVDQRMHRYFPDFIMMVKNRDGSTSKYLIEIKPQAQTEPPVKGKKRTNRYLEELATYAVNQAKWKAAEEACRKNGLKFQVLTEQHLF